MKKLNTKIIFGVVTLIMLGACGNQQNHIINAIQGKWYNIDGSTKTIEIKGDKWIEDVQEFGKTVYQISSYNDSVYQIKVIENTNTLTRFTIGMNDYIKINLKPNMLNFEYTDTTGRKGFSSYYLRNK